MFRTKPVKLHYRCSACTTQRVQEPSFKAQNLNSSRYGLCNQNLNYLDPLGQPNTSFQRLILMGLVVSSASPECSELSSSLLKALATKRRLGLGSLSRRVQVPNIQGVWSQIPSKVWVWGPESLNIGYLDPLGLRC